MTMHNALHRKSVIDRLNLPRKKGGRVLISAVDAATIAILGLESYVRDSTESLIVAARNVVRSITEEESLAAVKKQITEKKITSSGEINMVERWKHKERNCDIHFGSSRIICMYKCYQSKDR